MRFILLFCCLILSYLSYGQGTTSSDMRGIVTDANGEPIIGATVAAVHVPSGSTYGTATNEEGNYQLPGLRVGGPYTVTVAFTGFSPVTLENVELRLGETFRHDFILSEENVQLEAVMVVASSGVTGQTAGTSTQISTEKIEATPTLNRDINDFLKLVPQGNPYSDGISLAGVNNRYNAIYIDGAVNNDMYGISSSGTNGGQTTISPFSIDIIDQFQIVLSPYDVSLGGFAGGGINAVTKSGTNKLQATAYYFTQNESLAGKTPGLLAKRLNIPDSLRTKLNDFTKRTYGASLGGAIKKDKIFFYTNVELQKDETPVPFELQNYTNISVDRANETKLNQLRNFLINTYNYDPGTFTSTSDQLDGLKIFGKLDFNLGTNHRLTLRHQYTKAEQFDRNGGSSTTINFSNNGVFFPSSTNSSALELKSRLGQNSSNDLIVGYTTVKDDRDAIGSDFPYLIINDASAGTIRLGTEEFSTANLLEQSVLTLTDNFKIYSGNHTFTLGTHNEFSSFNNIFIGSNFGTYTFANIDSFINGANAINYDRSYSLIDEAGGDNTKAAADFNALQLGFYAQDQWTISPKFTLTGGIRLDIPVITTDPALDQTLADSLYKMAAAYPVAANVTPGKAPDGQLMFSPRVGFEYAFDGNRKTILRGGAGIFTSRIPFVWPGAMFTNNGLTIGRVQGSNLMNSIPFVADVNAQYKHPNFAIPSGQVDIFVNDFKYPQVFRTNLAIDTKFGNGFQFGVEGLFTKTLNNIVYTNVNSDPTVKFHLTGGGDDRAVYFRRNFESRYSAVYVGSNTNKGYTYNLTATLAKNFGKNFSTFLAYNYGDAYALNEGTSSQNSSQWRGQTSINGRNFPVLGRSDFAIGHRIIASASYKINWTEGVGTQLSFFYSGESGEAFSYVIGGGSAAQNINNEQGSTGRNRSLVYVPIDENDIHLVDYISGGNTVSKETQWTNLNAMIESDPGLRNHRGDYVEKNGSFAPFNHVVDLAIRQDIGSELGGDLHRIQLSLDIFNFLNLLNKDWGPYYTTPGSDFNNFQLYQFDGFEADGTTPKFSYRLGTATGKDIFNIGGTASRWRMRLGVRYILN